MRSLPTSHRRASFIAAAWLLFPGCGAVHLMQAERAYNLRQYEEAKTLAEQAVADDPKSVPANKLLGKILVRFGADALERDDVETAKRYFEEASNLSPRDPLLDGYLDMVRREERKREAGARLPAASSYSKQREPPKRQAKPSTSRTQNTKPAEKEASTANELTVKQGTVLYDAPSPFAAKGGDIRRARLNFIREAGGWFEVETKDGRRGYVKGEAVK